MSLSKSTESTLTPHEMDNEISCMCLVDKNLLIHNMNVTVGFCTTNNNETLTGIAIEQIEIFFDILMNNSIIVDRETYTEELRNIFSNNVFMVPGKINDQMIGSLIFSKLNTIVRNVLEINFVRISSDLGKNMRYTIKENSPELDALLPNKKDYWEKKSNPWWERPDPATYDCILEDGIYEGDFKWEDYFKEELAKAQREMSPKKRDFFRIIDGGKNEK